MLSPLKLLLVQNSDTQLLLFVQEPNRVRADCICDLKVESIGN